MMIRLFEDGKLNALAFDMAIRRATHDLNDVLVEAVRTGSPLVESTHFLMVLGRISGGLTLASISKLRLTAEAWESGLSACVTRQKGSVPPAHLTEGSLDESARAMLRAAEKRCAAQGRETICEAVLLVSGLENLTAAVRSLFESVKLDVEEMRGQIEESLRPVAPIEVFNRDSSETVKTDSFSPQARKVLGLVRTEAESLGCETADARHLLLALLEQDGGALQYGLHQQDRLPRRVQSAVTINLRPSTRQALGAVPLDRAHLQGVLARILCASGEVAAKDKASRVAEPHLVRAFLSVESVARRILEDEGIDVKRLLQAAERYDVPQEPEEADADRASIADVDSIRSHLETQLVGQRDAIERILPYIQRMSFGFSTVGRPVGVFLFCGPSGSGKTQMAKELAEAVFGSQENLTFLEMGQFNARESINIFVGAPPGYVGYGEGKLTNGLRDKPRSVVLFDEVEKAHSLVLDALLRFLDEGKIDDPAGSVRDGSQCIVVLTSNVGAEELAKIWPEIEEDPDWRSVARQRLRELFKKNQFRVEFLNRVDEIVFFRALGVSDYAEIARRAIAKDIERLSAERGIEVRLDGVCEAIGGYCMRISEGARAAKRLALSVVTTPVIDFVVRRGLAPPVKVRVQAKRASGDAGSEPYGVVEVDERSGA